MTKKIFIIIFIIIIPLISLSNSTFQRWGDYIENDLDKGLKLINIKNLLYSAGTIGGIYFVSKYDSQWNQSIQKINHGKFKVFLKITNELGNTLYTIPSAAIIAASSLITKDDKFQDAAFTSLSSVLISDMFLSLLKLTTGRARPEAGKGPYYFKPFSRNISFPSVHAASSFALLTPWILYYPNVFTYSLFILPIGTGLARMVKNRHWATDVIAGSIIGFGISYLLTEWHKQKYKEDKRIDSGNNQLFKISLKIPL